MKKITFNSTIKILFVLIPIVLYSFNNPSGFSIYGNWRGEDTHHQKLEIIFSENLNASILYPESPKNNPRNQTIKYKIENTKNDSLFYVDFEKSIKNMDGTVLTETTYCSIKFMDQSNLILIDHPNKKSRVSGMGAQISLSKY